MAWILFLPAILSACTSETRALVSHPSERWIECSLSSWDETAPDLLHAAAASLAGLTAGLTAGF